MTATLPSPAILILLRHLRTARYHRDCDDGG